ncbi:RICIN domain-containing protein [Streptomyces sp. NPDC059524]|uniref:RICIN domain-containing protein n=1 Tax=Streptomyces sp. NPDC059524 TaxID=3346856 RepID=UPI0036C7371A
MTMGTTEEATASDDSASAEGAGLPESDTVVCWASVRSRLRMGVLRESVKDGAQIVQKLSSPRDDQKWRLVVVGEENGEVLYKIENVGSGKALEIPGATSESGAIPAQRDYEGDDAHHQQWRLVRVGAGIPAAYEIANRNSGLLLQSDSNNSQVIKQSGAEGDERDRQWHLFLP